MVDKISKIDKIINKKEYLNNFKKEKEKDSIYEVNPKISLEEMRSLYMNDPIIARIIDTIFDAEKSFYSKEDMMMKYKEKIFYEAYKLKSRLIDDMNKKHFKSSPVKLQQS